MDLLGGGISALVGVVLTWFLNRVDRRNLQRHHENEKRFTAILQNQEDQRRTLGALSERVSYLEGSMGRHPNVSVP